MNGESFHAEETAWDKAVRWKGLIWKTGSGGGEEWASDSEQRVNGEIEKIDRIGLRNQIASDLLSEISNVDFVQSVIWILRMIKTHSNIVQFHIKMFTFHTMLRIYGAGKNDKGDHVGGSCNCPGQTYWHHVVGWQQRKWSSGQDKVCLSGGNNVIRWCLDVGNKRKEKSEWLKYLS